MLNNDVLGVYFLEQEVLCCRFFEKNLLVNWSLGRGRRRKTQEKNIRNCANSFLDSYSGMSMVYITIDPLFWWNSDCYTKKDILNPVFFSFNLAFLLFINIFFLVYSAKILSRFCYRLIFPALKNICILICCNPIIARK